MEAGIIIVGIILAALLVYLIYMVHGMPGKLDKEFRFLLVEYKKWAENDNRHMQRRNLVRKRQKELDIPDERSLDYLRLERAKIRVELDQIENLDVFQKVPESAAQQQKSLQLEEVENRIDEHPDREKELEETRSRLVARMEDIKAQDGGQ